MANKEWTIQDFKDLHGLRASCKVGDKASHSPGETSQEVSKTHNYVDSANLFANNILRQTKKLSQLIAYSWLENEKARKIREIFRRATADDSELKQLLTGQFPDLWCEPIFTESEVALYSFQINWDTFIGTLIEEQQAIMAQCPPYFRVNLPYPPRPALGETTVTLEQIQEWADSPLEFDENGTVKNPFPPYPYIPCSSA
jgi:hypothetical protein